MEEQYKAQNIEATRKEKSVKYDETNKKLSCVATLEALLLLYQVGYYLIVVDSR